MSCGLFHGTSGSDQWATETCQPGCSSPNGARRAVELGVWPEPPRLRLLETSAHVQNVDIALSLLLFSSLSNTGEFATFCWGDGSVYHHHGRGRKARTFCAFFPFASMPVRPIYLFPHHAATGRMGLKNKACVNVCVCVCLCLCVFKVEKLCLAGTIKHMDWGEDGQLWLCVCLAGENANDLKSAKDIQRWEGGRVRTPR